MYSIDEKFEILNGKLHNEYKLYSNTEVTAENYNFPHIYLTDEEIGEFNEECRKAGIDLKVVPLSDYKNVAENNLKVDPDKKIELINDCFIEEQNQSKTDENSFYENEEEKSDLEFNFQLDDPKENQNQRKKYLNIKRKLTKNHKKQKIEDKDKNNDKSIYNSNDIDDDKNASYFSFKNDKKNKNKNNKNRSENVSRNKKKKVTGLKLPKNLRKNNSIKDNNNKDKKDNNNIKEKKNQKDNKEKYDKKNNFDNLFRKIKETSNDNMNEDKLRKNLIQQIMKNSENLTKDGLVEMANGKHIGIVGDQFKIYDLQKMTSSKLNNLLGDIDIDSKLNILYNDNKNSIKTIKNKEEMKRKSIERALIKKKRKEEEQKKKND